MLEYVSLVGYEIISLIVEILKNTGNLYIWHI